MIRARCRAFGALAALAAAGLWSSGALATLPGVFGADPRSVALARSDVADAQALSAGAQNPAAAAAPGFALRFGYGRAGLSLKVDDLGAPLRDPGGIALAAQVGGSPAKDFTIGAALSAHIPDASIARIAFRPATEPQFVLYDSSLHRTTFDTVLAVRWRFLSIGGGTSATLDVAGKGTDFSLGQDASGTYADARTDIELPYRFAPLVGARAELGPVSLGASFRGALAVDLSLTSVDTVALQDNPLNGTTTVRVHGESGWDPATLDLGARVGLGRGLSAHGALEVAFWSAAPPPIADVTLDVQLQTTPGLREARFVEPRFRDSISPRLGLELLLGKGDGPGRQPDVPGVAGEAMRGDDDWRFAIRGGWSFSPSPVPRQTGFTSYADSGRHLVAMGAALELGRWAGVEVGLGLGGQLHVLAGRTEQKDSDALPHARYRVGGTMLYGTAALEGRWR